MSRKAYRDAYVSAHISNTVAAQIAALRDARGWTQTDLAKRAGMKQPRISALEDPDCENFEIETIKRIAAAFDVGVTVKFVPYSEIVEWAGSISDENLYVPSFDSDMIASPHVLTTAQTKTIPLPHFGDVSQAFATPVPVALSKDLALVENSL